MKNPTTGTLRCIGVGGGRSECDKSAGSGRKYFDFDDVDDIRFDSAPAGRSGANVHRTSFLVLLVYEADESGVEMANSNELVMVAQ